MHTAGKNTVEWKCKDLHLEKHNLMQQNRLVSVWRAAFQKGSWTRVNMCPCHKDSGIPGCIRESIVSRLRRWPLPSTQHWWGSSRMLDPVLGSPIEKDMGSLKRGHWKDVKVIYSLEHMRKCWESWDCSAWKRKIMGGVYPCVPDGEE